MIDSTQTDIIAQLLELAPSMQTSAGINSLFNNDKDRFSRCSVASCGLLLDYSKNPIDADIMQLLLQLAESCNISGALGQLFSGDIVNHSEQQAALHPACRMPTDQSLLIDGEDWGVKVQQQLAAMTRLVDRVHTKKWLGYSGLPITDVVNVGIGGSDLGPAMCVEALQSYACSDVNMHFISNVDLVYLKQQLNMLNPATTLFIIASKSFSTPETLLNANVIKQWLIQAAGNEDAVRSHFMAVTAHVAKALQFGINEQHILPMWCEVGGRYSIWSSVGLPLALCLGMDGFKQFLAGAHAMDQHVQTADLAVNMPVILALIDIWLGNFMALNNRAIIPYSNYLKQFPDYMQQLCMESQGKSVDQAGQSVDWRTGLIIWGGCGTNSQHSFHQLLMQGNQKTCIDFILPKTHFDGSVNSEMIANCLAQSQVLMQGFTSEDTAYKSISGNTASNTIIMDKLDPATLGTLIALYEHKVFVQSVIWGVNPFDQWGVERGKVMAHQVLADFTGRCVNEQHDESTRGLLHYLSKGN